MSRALLCLAILTACAPAPEDEGEQDEGCTSADDCGPDQQCVDEACVDCVELYGEPNDPCLPKCGTKIGVGQPCTKGGGECNNNGDAHATFCTLDFVDDADLHMCTGPCFADEDCGEDAVCQGDPADPESDKGCVPASCASE